MASYIAVKKGASNHLRPHTPIFHVTNKCLVIHRSPCEWTWVSTWVISSVGNRAVFCFIHWETCSQISGDYFRVFSKSFANNFTHVWGHNCSYIFSDALNHFQELFNKGIGILRETWLVSPPPEDVARRLCRSSIRVVSITLEFGKMKPFRTFGKWTC